MGAPAEPIPDGPSTEELVRLARTHELPIGAGLIEQAPVPLHNAFVVETPNGNGQGHRELYCLLNEHMASGDEFTVLDAPGLGRPGILTT